MMKSKQQFRKYLRELRKAVSLEERYFAANRICEFLVQLPNYHQSQHIAAFYPCDGEIDPRPFLDRAIKAGKHCYLPVLSAGSIMQFAPYSLEAVKPNKYGIPEPSYTEETLKTISDMSMIIVPMVGFDKMGNRLGMGGGYYDKALLSLGSETTVVGVAFAKQGVNQLPTDNWDISLPYVVTEQKIHQFNTIQPHSS